MKKISIVLPVYNVDKYLDDCIISIIEQKDFCNCEILLIDDGSTDKSALICDRYAEEYDNISVYHKTNGGLSDARNYGLLKSKMDYVLFVDSDDILIDGAISMFIKHINEENIDILIFDAMCIDENGKKLKTPDFEYIHVGLNDKEVLIGTEALYKQLKAGMIQTTVWLGLYKRNFLIKNQLWFKRNLLHEDELWTPIVFIEAKKVGYIKKKLYSYRIRENSIMNNKNKDNSKNIASLIYIYSHITRIYDSKIKDKNLLELLKDDISKRYLHVIVKWKFYLYPELMKNVDKKEILRNTQSKKNKLRALLLLINSKIYYKTIVALTNFK